jgi:hypothetical protein
MSIEAKKITVRSGSEIASILDMAAKSPLLLEKDGVLFTLNPLEPSAESQWASYDPKAAVSSMRSVAGAWSDLDPDKLKSDIYRAREEGSRPATRP